jgi:hypothetical protein
MSDDERRGGRGREGGGNYTKYVTFTNVKIKSQNSKFYNKNPIKSGT